MVIDLAAIMKLPWWYHNGGCAESNTKSCLTALTHIFMQRRQIAFWIYNSSLKPCKQWRLNNLDLSCKTEVFIKRFTTKFEMFRTYLCFLKSKTVSPLIKFDFGSSLNVTLVVVVCKGFQWNNFNCWIFILFWYLSNWKQLIL